MRSGLARSIAFSRLARLIVLANCASLAVLVLGVWLLNDTRAGLTDARIASLKTQGQLIKRVLERDATLGEPEPLLRQVQARATIKGLNLPDDVRARLYNEDGVMIADSFRLSDRVIVRRLANLGEREGLSGLAFTIRMGVRDLRSAWRGTVLERRTLDEEVDEALLGETAFGERLTQYGRVASVSLPIQHVQAVVGVLTLESSEVDQIISSERRSQIPFIIAAAATMLLSSILLTLFIAQPVRRLAFAADRVTRYGPKRASIPNLASRGDEIGQLSASFSTMTTALTDRINAIEAFTADVAHEIKNPLTSIRSAVETLPSARDDSQRGRLLSVIRHDVMRIDRLISDISRASRVDAELGRAQPSSLDLSAFLARLVDLYGAIESDVKAEVQFEGVRGGGRLHVHALAEPLGQVFHNLIDNARTFSPADGVVTVRVAREVDLDGSAYACASVEDEGPGIPDANIGRIFDRFFTERPEGAAFGSHSGLGLAIARQIVESHGGQIRAENRDALDPGARGARFVVRLPLQRA